MLRVKGHSRMHVLKKKQKAFIELIYRDDIILSTVARYINLQNITQIFPIKSAVRMQI